MKPVFSRYFSPVYFVTFCTHQRRKILANASVQTAFTGFAQRALAEHAVQVGRYVIMPEHVHLFVTGGPAFRLGDWMRLLKLSLGRTLQEVTPHKLQAAPTVAGRKNVKGHAQRIWQEGFFDHLLRHEESMAQKWDYVRENPVRAGLVRTAEDWPYQGEIAVIDRV